jgi:beta-N-acetylhexosaminidase
MKFQRIIIFIFLSALFAGCSVKKRTLATDPALRLALIEQIMSHMSLEQKIGQLLMISIPGQLNNPPNATLLEKIKPGSIIFFKHNFSHASQVRKWFHDIQMQYLLSSGIPVFLTTDQEYGRVKRLREKITLFPNAMAIGAANDKKLTRSIAFVMASELGAYGMNMNLAPVSDINNNPNNPVIRERSFGTEALQVAMHVGAYIAGFHDAGLASVSKHFPGHGDTNTDSHLGLPVIHKDFSELEKSELIPFQQAIKKRVDGVMTAHIIFPALDPKFPATLSYPILTDLLRGKLNFQGLIITDDMDMGAIVNHFYKNHHTGNKMKPSVTALLAGADILIFTGKVFNTVEAFENIRIAYLNGTFSKELLNQKVKHILDSKIQLYFKKNPLSWEKSMVILNHTEEILKKSLIKGIAVLQGNRALLKVLLKKTAQKDISIFSDYRRILELAGKTGFHTPQKWLLSAKSSDSIPPKEKLWILITRKKIPSSWQRLYQKNRKKKNRSTYYLALLLDNPFGASQLTDKADFILTSNGDFPAQMEAFMNAIKNKGQDLVFMESQRKIK